MSDNNINLTAPIHAATTLGKAVAAREVFMDGDKETVQQIGDKTHQLEDAIKDITATGGASTANAVSYSNETSGMTAVTAQGAIDELAAKNKTQDSSISTKAEKADVQASVSELKAKNTSQDAEIAKKANVADVSSQMQTEQTRINSELDKKFNKEDIAQELGESEDKVVSQKVINDLGLFKSIDEDFIFKILSKDGKEIILGIKFINGKYILYPIDDEISKINNTLKNLDYIKKVDDSDFLFKIASDNETILGIKKENKSYKIRLLSTSVKDTRAITLNWYKGTYSGENNYNLFFSDDFTLKEGEIAKISYKNTYSFVQIVGYKGNKTKINNNYIINTEGSYRIEGGFNSKVTESQLMQITKDFNVFVEKNVDVNLEPVSAKAALAYSKPIVSDNVQKYKKDYIDICNILSPTWGNEYLEHWYEKIYNGTENATIVLSGDSITQGDDPKNDFTDYFFGMRNYFIKKIMKAGGYDLSKLNVINCGVGGCTTNEFVGNSTYGNSEWLSHYQKGFLDEDMKLSPDLYILGWGMNDVLENNSNLSLEEKLNVFSENMNESLARIRGNNSINGHPAYNKSVADLSIIICLPTVGGLPKTGRGYEYWNQYIREIIIPICRRYFCAYADFSFRTYQHTEMPKIWGGQGNNPSIHPNKFSQAQTMSLLQDLIYPIGLWQVGEIEHGGTNDKPRYIKN